MSEEENLRALDLAAALSVGFFICVWLIMAPPFSCLRAFGLPRGVICYDHEYQKMWNWISSMGPITDWLLVGVGVLQWRVYAKQAVILQEQTRISDQQTMILQGRPVLYPLIRKIGAENFRTTSVDSRFPSGQMSFVNPNILFALKNYGTAPIVLLDVGARLVIGPKPPPEPKTFPYIPMPEERMIAPGAITTDFASTINRFRATIDIEGYRALRAGETHVWMLAQIVFADIFEKQSLLHLCWRCNVSLSAADPYPTERNYIEKTIWIPHDPPSARGDLAPDEQQ